MIIFGQAGTFIYHPDDSYIIIFFKAYLYFFFGHGVLDGIIDKISKNEAIAPALVTRAAKDVNSISDQSKEIQAGITGSNSLIGELNESLENNSTQMKDSFADMRFTAVRVFMSLAKLDHVLWKVNTYYSAATKEEQFKFVDHHSCRLGKWYYEGDGKDNFSKTSSYSKLEKPHAVVHNGTNKVFNLMAEENINVDALLNAFKEMEDGSDEVFSILDQILHDKG